MILARLDLKAFGRFTDVTLDLSAGPRRFHLIYGPNESGKSTSLRAITSLLFGIHHRTEDNFLHANPHLRVGGLLIDGDQEFGCVRRKGKKATLRDADDDQPIDENVIAAMLNGIQRESFLSRFGLSHEALVEGGREVLSGEGDLGQILFSAGAGIGRLRDIQKELDDLSASIFTPRGTKTSIAKSIQTIQEQRGLLHQAQVPPAEYRDLRERLVTRRTESEQLSKQIEKSIHRHNQLRHFKQAVPLIPSWRATTEMLNNLRESPHLDEAFTERRRQTVSDREIARSRSNETQRRITEMKSRLKKSPVDDAILHQQKEIQSVFQEVASRNKAERDGEGLLRNRNNLDRKIADLLGQLSADIPAQHTADRWPEAMEHAIDKLKLSDSSRNRIRQLASSYETLISQRNEASDSVESTQRRADDVCEELAALGTPTDPIVVSNAIDAVGNPQTMLEAVTDQRNANHSLQERCEQLSRRLAGFDGDLDQAAELTLPAPSQIRSLTEAIDHAKRERENVQNQALQSKQKQEELAKQISQQQSELPLPTLAELTTVRQQRDSTASQVRQLASDSSDIDRKQIVKQVDELCQHIDLADQLNDTMRTHHQQIHQREQSARQLAQLTEQCHQLETEATAASDSVKIHQQRWKAAWKACGIEAGEPERMQSWVTDHALFCETLTQCRDGERRMEQLQNRIDVALKRLSKALTHNQPASVQTEKTPGGDLYQGGLFAEPTDELPSQVPSDDLISLYDSALAARGKASHQRQHFDALRRRRDELAEESPKAEIRLETAQKKIDQWREEWQRVTESFTGDERVGTDEVSLMLDQITDLHNKKRERDILVRRIHSIGEDESNFQSRVDRLVATTQLKTDTERPTTEIAHELYQKLQAELSADNTRSTLRDQIDQAEQRLSEAQTQQNACEAVLAELCKEAECETADELPEIERASAQRCQFESELRDLENQLVILAGDIPLAEFIEEAGKQQPGTLESQIADEETRLKQQRERQADLQQQVGAIQHELEKIDGGAQASELVQSIQFTAGELNRDCEDYARTKIASMILRRAIDHYRKAHQSPILKFANKYFQQLTCDSYRELRPDYDPKGRATLFGIKANGDTVPSMAMSDGTADTLYLALRLASLEYQIGLTKPIPLVIDDCLIQLDDQRAAAALHAFSDLSETTQVILFTHHQHVIELAQQTLNQGDYHLHTLA
ncbi:MAG: AAA family ATPase [Rubripirellula sp.]|nr:AAA family ATPase [Rubripirellula sp.]